ncbi:MAG TPA: fumarate reductase subunit C [Casimicrobiaceae bacterium]
MSARRPYVRSMDGWWRRNPFYVRYMIREATAVLVVAYAAVLLVGAIRLSQGEAAYNGWLEALRSPWSLAFHVVLLAGFLYHTWSWFRIMPKTMPMLFVGGRRVAAKVITGSGLAAAAVLSVVLLLVLMGIAR